MVTNISKAHWNSDGENLRLSMPFSKVDKERRIVSGFASLDNLDKQMDIVTAEASMKAFAKFRGNIREMHQPLAVGKMVNFKEDKYFLKVIVIKQNIFNWIFNVFKIKYNLKNMVSEVNIISNNKCS